MFLVTAPITAQDVPAGIDWWREWLINTFGGRDLPLLIFYGATAVLLVSLVGRPLMHWVRSRMNKDKDDESVGRVAFHVEDSENVTFNDNEVIGKFDKPFLFKRVKGLRGSGNYAGDEPRKPGETPRESLEIPRESLEEDLRPHSPEVRTRVWSVPEMPWKRKEREEREAKEQLDEESGEYERFEELTRRLAQVPKEEVDDAATRTSIQRRASEEEPDDASGDGSAEKPPS